MILSEKLKLLRIEKGKTQQQASSEMKIAISSLRNYENGKIPDTTQLKIIKNYYNVTYEYLLDDECENKDKKTFDIGNALKLSDISIKNIKDLQYFSFQNFINKKDIRKEEDIISPKAFNFFIENFNSLQNFALYLNTLIKLIQIYNDLDIFLNIYTLQFYIIDCLDNARNLKPLINLLKNTFDDMFSIVKNIDNNISVEEDYFLDINHCCTDLEYYCNSYDVNSKLNFIKDNSTTIDSSLMNILSDFLEFSSTCKCMIYKEINYTKYELNKLFSNFFDDLGGNSLELENNIPKELTVFIKKNNYIKNQITHKAKNNNK